MVKGVSRQVIVVQSPDPKLFDQAIFILKEGAIGQGITEDDLLKEAQQVLKAPAKAGHKKLWLYGPVWACGGALLTGAAWLLTILL